MLYQVKKDNALKATYQYMANGTKLSVRNGNGNTGYDYDGSFVYTVTDNTLTLEAAHFAGGQLKPTGVNYTLTDHLGSVRAVVDATGTIQEQNDYYPFGSKHVNTGYASNDNRYTFNGKERQDLLDLNTYDFGARMYDSDIARWTTVDPLCEDYYSQSLFNYCGNDPVNNITKTGFNAPDQIISDAFVPQLVNSTNSLMKENRSTAKYYGEISTGLDILSLGLRKTTDTNAKNYWNETLKKRSDVVGSGYGFNYIESAINKTTSSVTKYSVNEMNTPYRVSKSIN